MKGGLHLLRPAAAVAVLAALAAIPTEVLASLPVVCVWRTFLHVECPGCGMTRALSSALHGHLSEAVAFNRGVLLVLPAALVILIRDFHALWPRDALWSYCVCDGPTEGSSRPLEMLAGRGRRFRGTVYSRSGHVASAGGGPQPRPAPGTAT
jgi:uncharacterized protein DUF2752